MGYHQIRNVDDLPDARGTGGHHDDARSQIDRLIDGVCAAHDGLAFRRQHFQQQTALVNRVLKNINLSTNVEEAVSKADLVIEAIMENVAAKQKLFAQVESAIPRLTNILFYSPLPNNV